MNDIQYAVRQLVKHPGFTAVVVLTLALGIGANTAIYSVIDGVLLRPAPFEDAGRLAVVWQTDRNSSTTREPASVPDFLDFDEHATTFTTLAAFAGGEANLVPDAGDPTRLATVRATHGFLPMVGISPVAGRGFTAEEDRAGAAPVALIGEGLWERLFSRSPDAVGRSLRLDGVPTEIVGILPSGADFGVLQILGAAAYSRAFADRVGRTTVDVWVPLRPDPRIFSRDTHPIFVAGRLAASATFPTAQEEMAGIAAELEATYPGSNNGRGVNVEPLLAVVFGPVRPALYMLLVAVGLVLLVACVNVANLLLARGTARLRDVAVRTALGAGARRLARQFLVEGVLLALLGGALGVLLAVWGTQALLALAPHDVPRLADVGMNVRVLGATLGISVVVGLVFGMVPILQSRRVDLQSSLKLESGGSVAAGGSASGRVRSALVVAQLALAVMLVVGAGLLIKSFWRLTQVDTGFQTAGVLKAEFQLPRSRYPVDFSVWPNFREMHEFNRALLDRVMALPGVEAAAIAGNSPVDQGFTNSFNVVGREAEAVDWPEIAVRRVTAGYLRTVGLPLLRGRGIEESDRTDPPLVALINAAALERFFPDGEALGEQINMWGAGRTIVGVVANERIYGPDRPAPPAVYFPLPQAPSANGAQALLIRTKGAPGSIGDGARRAINELDAELAVFGVEPLKESVSRSVGQRRFTMLLLTTFAALATVLAMIGVHGVLSYAVAQRSRELGVRMALGATRRNVVQLVVRQGMLLAAVGLALGMLAAFATTRLLRSLLFGVSETDPVTMTAVAVAVTGAAFVASYLPALRAARVDPMEALRHE
ncbi:MAG TPA: ABC transporter permease [Gemmatimonadales bacterium]|jgi:predicted permease